LAALKRSGLRIADIGTFEVNEAFASVAGAWLAETGAETPTAPIHWRAPSPSGALWATPERGS
jgi:acetyl-CoA acetyltransferase